MPLLLVEEDFFQVVAVSVLLYGCTTWPKGTLGEKARCEPHNNAACCFEQTLEAATRKTASVRLTTLLLTKHPSKDKTSWALVEKLLISDVLL